MGTVSKALVLLDLFDQSRTRIGLSDLARLSGQNKATVHRLMTELQARGFVEQVGAGREYRLGPAVLRLAALRETAVPMRETAQATVRALSDETEETAHMSLIEGDRLVAFAHAYSAVHGIRVTMEDADILPWHATGSGLAALAFSTPGRQERLLDQPLTRFTDRTLTDADALRPILEDVRRAGLAESLGGFEAEVHSCAAPLFDAVGTCIGALAVAAPTARITPALLATMRTAVRRHAMALTQHLGGCLPEDYPQDAAA